MQALIIRFRRWLRLWAPYGSWSNPFPKDDPTLTCAQRMSADGRKGVRA